MSYCNTGYVLLGQLVEVLTGAVWDQALRELLVEPLGLTHTWTLAEDVVRHRAALGHETGTDGVVPLSVTDAVLAELTGLAPEPPLAPPARPVPVDAAELDRWAGVLHVSGRATPWPPAG